MQYSIECEPFPVVICNLSAGETMQAETGSMSWMSSNITMKTEAKGGISGMLGRMVTGESIFLNQFTASGDGYIAFSSSFPGQILAVEINAQKELIIQKSGFLAASEGVKLSVFFQKKLGAGLVGGEGFIMQRLSGKGIAFVEVDGGMKIYKLADNQKIILNTGYVIAMDSSCSIDIQTVSGVKNILFGGQGMFNTVITGPGQVYVQTKPIQKLVNILKPYFPQNTDQSS